MATPVTRRAALASGLGLGLAGVGGIGLVRECALLPGERAPEGNPAFGDVSQRGDLRLSSPTFEEGERIPNRFGHFFEDVNPPLAVGGVPGGAHSLVLVMDGPDAPGGEYTHWLVWNIPPDIGTVPEGWNPPEGVVQGGNSPGGSDYGYVGPDPPNKQWYRFKLYAVTEPVGLSRGASKRALGEAMDGTILAQTQLAGWYDFHTSAHESIGANEGHTNVVETVCTAWHGR